MSMGDFCFFACYRHKVRGSARVSTVGPWGIFVKGAFRWYSLIQLDLLASAAEPCPPWAWCFCTPVSQARPQRGRNTAPTISSSVCSHA